MSMEKGWISLSKVIYKVNVFRLMHILYVVNRHKFSCVASTTENFLGARMFVLKHPVDPAKFLEV